MQRLLVSLHRSDTAGANQRCSCGRQHCCWVMWGYCAKQLLHAQARFYCDVLHTCQQAQLVSLRTCAVVLLLRATMQKDAVISRAAAQNLTE